MFRSLLIALSIAVVVNISDASSSVCDSISFVSRDEWGALPSNLTDMRLPVHHVFIHHTFEEECHDQPECSRLMRIMQQFHNVTRGFGDIGYNFIIGGDNNVYVGRGWYKNGRHTYGMNNESVAFSLMGDYTGHLPSKPMMELALDLVQCGIDNNVIAADYQLHGHRDQVCTDCPGDRFYNEIQSWPRYTRGPLNTYACPYP